MIIIAILVPLPFGGGWEGAFPFLGEPEGAPYSTNQIALVFLVPMNGSDIGIVLSSPISALLHRGSCADA